MPIMHSMKILTISMAILALITYSGIYSFVDAHVFSWIPSFWFVVTQKAVAILIGLSIIAYATLYVYYAFKHTDKTTSQ
jgi:hypothetical protein